MKREEDIIKWARDRYIFDFATPDSQHGKTLEEVQELTDALAANNEAEIKDAIGDIVVTLILQAHMHGWSLEECVEAAYQEIKDRKGRMVNGVFVKEGGVIYAIHRKTKEHRIVPRLDVLSSHDWRYAVADADGWIPWEGGECPLPRGAALHWRCRDGSEFGPCNALDHPLEWRHGMEIQGEEIIAYRPILDERSEREAQESCPRCIGFGIDPDCSDKATACAKCDGEGVVEVGHPTWSGDGERPPVGSRCLKGHMEVMILAYADVGSPVGPAIVYQSISKPSDIDWAVSNVFSPIRSEEDRSIEEMTRVLMSLPIATAAYGDTARALYRAGYRKQEGGDG